MKAPALQSGWATRPGPVRPGRLRAAAQAAALALLLALAAGPWGAGPAAAAASHGARPSHAAPSPAGPDARADVIAKSLDDAMGGQAAWAVVPYIRFDFVAVKDGKELGRRAHWWDKAHSRDRVEWKDKDGRAVSAIVNLFDRTGTSATDGRMDADTLLAEHVKDAYEMWVNDTYWLMMPFKLHDQGSHLTYVRTEHGAGGAHDVLSLTFDPVVGLTPKDHYWLFINQKTHLLDRWEYLLQDQKPPPSTATWENWQQAGPVRLSTLHHIGKRPVMLRMENLAAPATMSEALFTNPAARG